MVVIVGRGGRRDGAYRWPWGSEGCCWRPGGTMSGHGNADVPSFADAPLRGPPPRRSRLDFSMRRSAVGGKGRAVRGARSGQGDVDRRDGGKPDADSQNFMWWRARMMGGRTNHLGGVSLRMGPLDSSRAARMGRFDWPIGYEEVRRITTRWSSCGASTGRRRESRIIG